MVTIKNQVVDFSIENLDPMGQGVAKNLSKINFIPKTLPGETGKAEVIHEKKGVLFSNVTSLTKKSSLRIENQCDHFDQCGGCHFLHTDYKTEIQFKMDALKRLMEKLLDTSTLKITTAEDRLFYRNRIQLHYNKKLKKMGFHKVSSHEIVQVPHCQIANKAILLQLEKLYLDHAWLDLVKSEANQGTIELYMDRAHVQIGINKPYAHLGFTQVNQNMNEKLKNWVNLKLNKNLYLIELFAGDGNLSIAIPEDRKIIFDFYPPKKKLKTFQSSVDLYHKNALGIVKNHLKKEFTHRQLLIDPPRSGLKNLDQWLELIAPKELIYISCNPQTFRRDIQGIVQKIKKIEVMGFDLFPGTHHLEIACHIVLH